MLLNLLLEIFFILVELTAWGFIAYHAWKAIKWILDLITVRIVRRYKIKRRMELKKRREEERLEEYWKHIVNIRF